MKRFISLGLVLSIILMSIAGCNSNETTREESTLATEAEGSKAGSSEASASNNAETSNEGTFIEGLPLQERPVRILNHLMGGKDPDENVLFEQKIKELSGIDVEIVNVSGGELATKITTAIASGEDYDIVLLGSSMLDKLIDMEVLEPLTGRIEESPVLGNDDIIDTEYWEEIRKSDGEIYGVFNKYEGGRLPLVRSDWMDNLGMDKAPETLDEYYELLSAFTFDDPDGNGKDDTIGFTLKNNYDIQPFMSSKGLFYGYGQDADGKWYIPWATNEAVEVYDWLNNMYEEGIIDQNFATNGSSNCRELIISSKAGMMVYWDTWATIFNDIYMEADPNTTAHISPLPPALDSNGQGILSEPYKEQWSIFNYSDNIEYAFKFLEFMHTEEGINLCTIGIEGYDYTIEDGVYTLTEIGKEHNMDHGMIQAVSKEWEHPMGVSDEFVEARTIIETYGKGEIMKDGTRDEAQEIVRKYSVQSIMGELTGQEAVDAMQKELKAKGFID